MSHYPEPKRGENEKDYEYWETEMLNLVTKLYI